jgi:acyl transferase domain-containing protein/acyl carrier protein
MDSFEILHPSNSIEIAIIGMAGRFPGAKNVDQFWQNLRNGAESIRFFSDNELISSGVDPDIVRDPNYVMARAVLADVELFDAGFFGFAPREAEIMDPQHRLFLECSWEALENAGYDADQYGGSIGVYAGAGMNTYLSNNLYANPDGRKALLVLDGKIGNDKDFLTTRVSYKLDLKGPSVVIQSACSTSLVAVHLACQGLLSGECDMALTGGVTVSVPQKAGYIYQQEGVLSPDGHCRVFDARAQGTVPGSGLGIVVLKRLEDALADGDCIHAIIKGSAINNDGSSKVGYSAPSVDRQANVIARALAMAEIHPETVGYLEAHGTGTILGDPIEIAALNQCFRKSTDKKGFCAIGSVKTNIGHIDAAAGVAALIKTTLMLEHKELLASLHFEHPNPKIDFAESPFYVNSALCQWKTDRTPRRAGVSCFGIGGTNAHVIVEQAPPREASGPSRPWQLIMLSAKNKTALEKATTNLVDWLTQYRELPLADVAYTLQVGRKAFNHRRFCVCRDRDDAVSAFGSLDPKRVFTAAEKSVNRPVAFMFPGQGAQYGQMGWELYQTESTFRMQIDRCAELLQPHLGIDLREVFYPDKSGTEVARRQLLQTSIAQPALFVIEYAMAQLWMELGVRPQAMIGHSIGEYVAACLAGVFSLEDGLALVAARGQLMQQLPCGAMLAVALPKQKVESFLDDHLALAAINAPGLCVVSGLTEAIDGLEAQLLQQEVTCRRLHTSHAFHSTMVDAILQPFSKIVCRVSLHPPQIPYLSNLTGTWITASQATDTGYWTAHLRQTVLFSAGLQKLLQEPDRILLEVGPGRTLSVFAKQSEKMAAGHVVLTSIRHPNESRSDVAFFLDTLGKLWLSGIPVEWSTYYGNERRYRLPLPTYPFERKRYWIEPHQGTQGVDARRQAPEKKADIADWFYVPSWKRSVPPVDLISQASPETHKLRWLIFSDTCGFAAHIAQGLEHMGQEVLTLTAGERFTVVTEDEYMLNPRSRKDYYALFEQLRRMNKQPDRIAHLWGVTRDDHASIEQALDLGFYSLLYLAQALGDQEPAPRRHIYVITNQTQVVTGDESLRAEKATALGPCKVIPQEYSNISCSHIDIDFPNPGTISQQHLVRNLLAELVAETVEPAIAYRGHWRWIQTFDRMPLAKESSSMPHLRDRGAYLITGGLGGVGLALAEYISKTVRGKLILTTRSSFPSRDDWDGWIAMHNDQDDVSQKILKIRALERLGADVMVRSADVADLQQMRSVFAAAEDRFGKIRGVIHAAGVVRGPSIGAIKKLQRRHCEQQFRPKVYGLLVLKQILSDRSLDFCMITSSLASVLGGFGFAAYAAANHFADTLSHQLHQMDNTSWLSVNWDGWRLTEQGGPHIADTVAALAMTFDEGVAAFERSLRLRAVPQVAVSTGDLHARFDQWIKLKSWPDNRAEDSSTHYGRPEMSNPYVAPQTETQRNVSAIWQELFGLDKIGIQDNFFDLGGHSLLAVRLAHRLCDKFDIDLPLEKCLELPTVAEMSTYVEAMRWVIEKGKESPKREDQKREEIEL